MNPRATLLEKISEVQRKLMAVEFGEDYNSIVPVVLEECQKHGLTFYFHDVDHHWLCTCPQYYFRKVFCKHMKACAEMLGIKDTTVYAEVA